MTTNSTVSDDDDQCERSLFNLINQAKSTQVTCCFLGLLAFTIIVEILIEHVEDKAQGTVIPQVLQKVYKELMLLGFVSFAIFIMLSGDGVSVSTTTVASFEYADCVMFFVGVGIISQTTWSIVCNQRFQRDIWVACGMDTLQTMDGHLRIMATPLSIESWVINKKLGLWLRRLSVSNSFEFAALNLQTFRMIFLKSHNLPDSFQFAYYLSNYLDAITVSFINIQPSSYFVLLVVILISEFLLRNRPGALWNSKTTALDSTTSFVLFGVFGLLLWISDWLWFRRLRSACYRLVFAQLDVNTVEEALVKNFVWASHSHERAQKSLATLNEDLKAYLDPRAWRDDKEKIKKKKTKFSGRKTNLNDETKKKKQKFVILETKDKISHLPSPTDNTLSSSSIDSASSSRSRQNESSSSGPRLLSKTSLKLAESFRYRTEEELTKKKKKTAVSGMIKHAKSTLAGSNRRSSDLSRVMIEDAMWVSEDAEKAARAAKSLLPFHSLNFVRAVVDALRLLKIFYIAIFITSIMVQSTRLPSIYAVVAWVGFLAVITSNAYTDPSITYYFVLLTTMASMNPLMLADTVEYMNDVETIKLQVASKMIELHRKEKRRCANLNKKTYVHNLLLQEIETFILRSFSHWSMVNNTEHFNDEADGGSAIDRDVKVDRSSFAQRLSSSGLHLSKRRIDILFKIGDPELTGYMKADVFFTVIRSTLDALLETENNENTNGQRSDEEDDEDEDEVEQLRRRTSESAVWNSLDSPKPKDRLLEIIQRQSEKESVWGGDHLKPQDSLSATFERQIRQSLVGGVANVSPSSALSIPISSISIDQEGAPSSPSPSWERVPTTVAAQNTQDNTYEDEIKDPVIPIVSKNKKQMKPKKTGNIQSRRSVTFN